MAKKFHFRLENVLRLRERQTQEAQSNLGLAARDKHRKQAEVDNAKRVRDEYKSQPQAERVSVRDMEARWYHSRVMDRQVQTLETEQVRLTEIETLKRTELSEAMQRQRVLEKLKDKKYQVHVRDENRLQQRHLDEIGQRTQQRR